MRPALLAAELAGMPLATQAPAFAYDLTPEASQPRGVFAQGLVEGLLELPIETRPSGKP